MRSCARRRPAAFAAAAIAATLAMTVAPAGARSRRVVELTGTYRGTLDVPPNVTVEGSPGARVMGTVVLRAGSRLVGVEVTGWPEGKWNFSAGVMVRGAGAEVRDCYIHDGPTHGIQVIGGFSDVVIAGNRIERVGKRTPTPQAAYAIANWRGISLEEGSDRATVRGNVVADPWENGIYERRSRTVRIVGNTIVRPNRGGVDRWNPGSGNGIEALSEGSVVERNVIRGAVGATLHGIVTGGARARVIDNEVRDVRGSGVYVIHGGDDRIVSGNRIVNVARLAGDAGIRLHVFSGVDPQLGTVLERNRIARVTSGVAVRAGPDGLVDRVTVRSNDLGSLRLSLVGRGNTVMPAMEPGATSPVRRVPLALLAVGIGSLTGAAVPLRRALRRR